jgi:hypothetical protein
MTAIILKTLKPENIKKDVTILNVTGTYEGGGGAPANEDITVDSSTEEQEFSAGVGYTGLGTVTVNPYTLDSKTVDASTASQIVVSDEDGLSSVTVNAVDASIDPNIQPSNIKSGVNILGVTGTLTSGDWLLMAKNGWTSIDTDTDGLSDIDYGLSDNLFEYSLVEEYTFRNQTTDGNYAFYQAFTNTPLQSVTFTDMTSVTGEYAFGEAFMDTSLGSGNGAVFSELTEINASYAMYRMFHNVSCDASFPKLETVTGEQAMGQLWEGAVCTHTGIFEFPELVSISGSEAMNNMFIHSRTVTGLSYPKLESIDGQYALQGHIADSNCRSLNMPRLLFLEGVDNVFRWFRTSSSGDFSVTTTPEFFKGASSNRQSNMYCTHIEIVIPDDYTYLDGWNNGGGTVNLVFNSDTCSGTLPDADILHILQQLGNVSDYNQVHYTVYFDGRTITDNVDQDYTNAYNKLVNAGWTINSLVIA